MSKAMAGQRVHRNIRVKDIVGYRLPPAGVVSILHRASGALLFLLTPWVVWLLDRSVSSEESFSALGSAFTQGIGAWPGWSIKLLVWVLIGAFLFHALAGVRHLWMDATHRVSLEQGHWTARLTLGVSAALWLAVGARLVGVY